MKNSNNLNLPFPALMAQKNNSLLTTSRVTLTFLIWSGTAVRQKVLSIHKTRNSENKKKFTLRSRSKWKSQHPMILLKKKRITKKRRN